MDALSPGVGVTIVPGVSVGAAVPPIVAAEDPQPPSAEAFRDGLEKQLRAVPYFSGGTWPAVTISVTLDEFASGIGGCWALVIPDVLLFPGWWLVGAPIACYYVTLQSTWDVSVGGFHRQYVLGMTDYSVRGLYYSGELFLHGDAYLGQTLWVLSQRLAEDFAAFQAGALPANPAPYQEDLDPDDSVWWDPLSEGTRTCTWLPDLPALSPEELAQATAIGVAVGTYLSNPDPASRAQAARSLGNLGGWSVLNGTREADDIEGILADPGYATEDPGVRTAVGEALGVIQCARQCVAESRTDCSAACGLTPVP